jgi:hypothetical protein
MNLNNNAPENRNDISLENQTAKPNRIRHCKLENLPESIRRDLDELIWRGHGERAIKKALLQNHGTASPLLGASVGTYRTYIQLHKPQIQKRQQITRLMAAANVEGLKEVEMVKDLILNPEKMGTPQERSKIFNGLLNRIEGRIKILEAAQDSTDPDPHTEQVIAGYLKEEKAILETLAKLAPQFENDYQKEFLIEIEYYTQVFINVAFNSYRIVNGDTNYALFAQTFKERLTEAVKNYRASKHQALRNTGA